MKVRRAYARVSRGLAIAGWAFFCALPAGAAPVTEKTPGIDAPATTKAGSADFLFAHNFTVTGSKVINSPTFLLDVGVLSWATLAARYVSRSTIAQRSNETELFGKISVISTARGQPLDVTIFGGYDMAAVSGIGQVVIGREIGPLGLLGVLRGFTAGYGYGGATAAGALGARLRLTRYFYLVGNISHVLGAYHWDNIKDQSRKLGWSAGIAFAIPYSPHSVSLYATNLQAHSMMESSRGLENWMLGFEFDVPFDSAKRWAAIFSPPAAAPAAAPAPPKPPPAEGKAAAPPEANVVEVDMKDMVFSPAKLTIRPGTTVRWTNHDAVDHTATSGDATWDSGTITPGQTFTHRFDTPGRYPYECTFHVDMTGEILVEPAPAGKP